MKEKIEQKIDKYVEILLKKEELNLDEIKFLESELMKYKILAFNTQNPFSENNFETMIEILGK